MERFLNYFRDPESAYTIKNIVIDFMLQNQKYIWAYLILSMSVPITNIYLPHLYGKLVSTINSHGTIDGDVQRQFLFIICIWLFVNAMWFVLNKVNGAFLPRLRSHVRTYVVERVIDTYKENYAEDELGGIMVNLARVPDEVDKFFFSVVDKVLPVVYTIIGAMIYFAIINPILGAVGALTIGGMSFWTFKMVQRCFEKNRQLNVSHEQLYSKINDSLGNLLNVYTANRDEHEKRYLDDYQVAYTDKQMASANCSGNFIIQTNLSYLALFSLLNCLSFYMYAQKQLKLEHVISILIVTLELISKMVSVIGTVNKLMVETSIISHVQGSLDQLLSKSVNGPGSRAQVIEAIPWDAAGDIVFKDVGLEVDIPKDTKSDETEGTTDLETIANSEVVRGPPPQKKKLLNNVNLEIPQGSTVIFKGSVGSSKTTLINSLIRLTPYTGVITINGTDIRDLSLTQLRDQVLYVPQNPRLFDRSVYENIAYGNDTPKEEVDKVLKEHDIQLDLDKQVGKFGQKLSGGQRQMVYLLRALFKKTPIVILDEPTASLDYSTKEQVMGLLQMLLKTRTVLMVSHDHDVMKYATMVVTMDSGKIVNVEVGEAQ